MVKSGDMDDAHLYYIKIDLIKQCYFESNGGTHDMNEKDGEKIYGYNRNDRGTTLCGD